MFCTLLPAANARHVPHPPPGDLYRRDETIQVTGNGHVQSPRFPNSYPRNLLLTWRLHSQEKTRIQLAFDNQFGLEEAENDICRYDFVEVEDVSETSTIIRGRWCGHKEVPPRITSRTNQIKITFKSDDYFVAKPGFKIYYSVVELETNTGTQMPWFLVNMGSQQKQRYRVEAEDNNQVGARVPITEEASSKPASRNDSSPRPLKGNEFHTKEDFQPAEASETNWESVTSSISGVSYRSPSVTDTTLTADALDKTIAQFDTVEDLLKHFSPESWQEDLENLYLDTPHHRGRSYRDRKSKVDLDRLNDDAKRYSCTPRNYSVNLREELKLTNVVFFPRCLLVQRCGGNCGCGTVNRKSCKCTSGKTVKKYHECVFFTVDLDRLNDDAKRYSCTPRNYSVNLREELKLTNVVFFPRCLLVQRCGGNCGCGTVNRKSCKCTSGKTVKKYHECVFFTVDLDRLNDDAKRYSCTPRNYSVNLREELKLTNVVFFPRCLLVQRCGGNCGCGTVNRKSCKCTSGKTVKKYHEVLKFDPGHLRRRGRSNSMALVDIQLDHHERCDCICSSRPPR
ncbi:Platelet-derived growth factor D [Myotis brandtii]|uniref:Platelet-derived growth factor D n=1 Tax=Myotis brandtii TaxID=109478 RepID=S7NW90_MYOBR|nr:Platelet-derived growth factor D [Myotis brandtii]